MGKGNRSCAQGMSGELYTGKSAQAIELTTGSLSVRQHSSMVSLVRDLDLGIWDFCSGIHWKCCGGERRGWEWPCCLITRCICVVLSNWFCAFQLVRNPIDGASSIYDQKDWLCIIVLCYCITILIYCCITLLWYISYPENSMSI